MKCSRVIVSLLATVAVGAASPLPTQAYQEVAVPDGGTLKGQVVFRGSPPPLKKIIPTKDQQVCGGIREESQIVLAQDGGVQDAVVYLKAIKAGKAWEKRSKPPLLDNLQCQYVPYVQVIPQESPLVITNSDPVLHTVHGFLGTDTLFNQALWKQYQRVEKQLQRGGFVRVNCDSHGWMRGWVYVADNPYYAITAQDGTFTLTDVPPGTYTLSAWQEYTEGVEVPVTVHAKEVIDVTIELTKQREGTDVAATGLTKQQQ